MAVRTQTRVSGPMVVEGEPTGDGRMVERGALTWEGVLPIPIVWDSEEGDHSGSVLGAIEQITRRPNGVVWGEGYLEDSDVQEFQDLVDRAREVLEQGAVGVSLRMDDETVEVRVKRELIEIDAVQEASVDAPETEYDEDENRVVVARFSADDVLFVTTSARVRHLAIVDTAAIVVEDGRRFGIAASGMLYSTEEGTTVAASALSGDWSQYAWMAEDPRFGDPHDDPRLRYDPDRGVWSCPPTVEDNGHFYGHITPMGICLRGRPDKCVNPPDGDLEGFMRGRAPFAGGLRTGVVCVNGGHCPTGVGVQEGTRFYDNTGYAVADVRVGRDSYGIWFAGMIRPGCPKEHIYTIEASDVSGHWELTPSGRTTLVGLPSVSVGGFPKGYMTYKEFSGGLAASAGITAEEGCAPWSATEVESETGFGSLHQKLDDIGTAVGELYAAHLRETEV